MLRENFATDANPLSDLDVGAWRTLEGGQAGLPSVMLDEFVVRQSDARRGPRRKRSHVGKQQDDASPPHRTYWQPVVPSASRRSSGSGCASSPSKMTWFRSEYSAQKSMSRMTTITNTMTYVSKRFVAPGIAYNTSLSIILQTMHRLYDSGAGLSDPPLPFFLTAIHPHGKHVLVENNAERKKTRKLGRNIFTSPSFFDEVDAIRFFGLKVWQLVSHFVKEVGAKW